MDKDGCKELTDGEKDNLVSIGCEFLKRYDMEYGGSGGQHEELVDDFLGMHSKELMMEEYDSLNEDGMASAKSNDPRTKWNIWDLIP
eukprot:2066652-Ditylum_brightwellii.AAC.1